MGPRTPEEIKQLNESSQAPLLQHLEELRFRLVRIAFILFIGFIACYGFSERIFDFLRKPIIPYLPATDKGLHFTGVFEKFMAHLKVSFLAGVLLTSPFWLYQVWRFIAPGLYKNEKRYLLGFLMTGVLLFVGGGAFAYIVVFPMAFHFLLNFGGTTDKPLITIAEYIDFVFKCFMGFGLTFEIPLILTMLGIMGIIDAKFLRKNRRWAVLIMAVLSAIVTPPDVVSMLSLMIPLLALYEISVCLVWIFEKRRKLPHEEST